MKIGIKNKIISLIVSTALVGSAGAITAVNALNNPDKAENTSSVISTQEETQMSDNLTTISETSPEVIDNISSEITSESSEPEKLKENTNEYQTESIVTLPNGFQFIQGTVNDSSSPQYEDSSSQ